MAAISNAFERHLLVAVDAVGYGSRKDHEHFAVQSGLTAVLDESAMRAGLHRGRWRRQEAGDGELAILPHGEPEPVVVDDYVRHLEAALAARNVNAPPRARMQLRMAIHFGAAMAADNGYAGQGVVAVSRLVESAPVRAALASSPGASLALILSRQVFEDVVRQGHVSFAEAEFSRVRVQVKEYQDQAWVKVMGGHRSATAPAPEPRSPLAAEAAGPAVPAVSNIFHGEVHAEHAVFGISHGRGKED